MIFVPICQIGYVFLGFPRDLYQFWGCPDLRKSVYMRPDIKSHKILASYMVFYIWCSKLIIYYTLFIYDVKRSLLLYSFLYLMFKKHYFRYGFPEFLDIVWGGLMRMVVWEGLMRMWAYGSRCGRGTQCARADDLECGPSHDYEYWLQHGSECGPKCDNEWGPSYDYD